MQNLAFICYTNNLLNIESDLKKVKKQIFTLYLARLILFLLLIGFLVLYIKFNNYLFLSLSFFSLVIFLFAVKRNLELSNREQFLSYKLQINKNELNSLEHKYHERERGDEYCNLNPHLAADFDLFGNGSLYQYLNRCSTRIGKDRFAENLCKSELSHAIIFEKQQAINELSEKSELIQDFQAYGKFIAENGSELSGLQSWLDDKDQKLKLLQLTAFIFPLIGFAWFMLVGLGVFSFNSVAIPISLNITIVGLNRKRIGKAHSTLSKSAKTFEKYYTLIKLIENDSFKSTYLVDLKHQFENQGAKASHSLKKLFKLLNSFDIRLNVFASFLLNALLLFDIHIYCRLAKWKRLHQNVIGLWFTSLSKFDALIGYATYAYNNNEQVTYPKISAKEFLFEAKEVGHPLLHPAIRICNTISFSGTPSVLIITGANMAGKSTFLRTLSVNLILAMNGAPVCAKTFKFTPCDIMSSIKIQDSLSNNESYFYAELLRLRDIIDHVKAQPKTLVILDEILRGTNTKDKQLGSLGLLEKLISQNSVVIVATHDLVIGELENKYPDIVSNHCFEVELTNDQLIFDYKLKKGISQKLNASFLMKKMEIIE